MSAISGVEIQHLSAPLPGDLARALIDFLGHKGPPWVDDLARRARGELPGADDHFFLALQQGQLRGHAWYTVAERDPRLGLIGHVYTHPAARRRGIARRLMEAALEQFTGRGGRVLQLFTSTPISLPLYQALGFEPLFSQAVYHDQDWYLRYPPNPHELQAWFAATPRTLRPLSAGDLPHYSLLYNVHHDPRLKDRAQQIGCGLEAELAFITTWEAVARGRARCLVLDNGQTILGAATLVASPFPHQSHLGLFDLYACDAARRDLVELGQNCLAQRRALGIEPIYAFGVDAAKRDLFRELGFTPRGILPRHYRVGQSYYDGELFEYTVQVRCGRNS